MTCFAGEEQFLRQRHANMREFDPFFRAVVRESRFVRVLIPRVCCQVSCFLTCIFSPFAFPCMQEILVSS